MLDRAKRRLAGSMHMYEQGGLQMVGAGKTGTSEQAGSVRDQAKVKTGNKDITKAVLASPLVIPW